MNIILYHGTLTRYVKLRVAHAPGMPGKFSPPPTSKETASKGSRHASRHVRDTRAVMHVGIANPRWPGNVPGIPGACATRNFTYLVRGPWHAYYFSLLFVSYKCRQMDELLLSWKKHNAPNLRVPLFQEYIDITCQQRKVLTYHTKVAVI